MQNKLKRIFAFICAFALLITTVFGNGVIRQAQAADSQEAVPATLDGFTNVTIKDFSKDGVQMPEGAYACTDATYGNYDCFSLTDGTSMNNKLFDANVTFTKGGGSAERIDIAGSGDWSGFMVYPSNDGSYLYVVSNTAYGTTSEWQHAEISASNADVTSFLNNEFLLQLSFEFGTVGGDNKADILVGVYVNGVKRTEHTFTGCNMAKFGGAIGIYRQAEGAVVTVNSVTIPREIVPVYLDGFNHITLKDFADTEGNVMEAGEYEGSSGGAHKDYYATGLTNFDDTVLSMKVKFEAGSYKNSLILAGTHGWQGFNIHPNNDGTSLVVDKTWISGMTSSETPTLSAGVAGVSSFLNEEFILQLSFEYSDAVDGKSDLTLGIYINGELYNNQKFTIAGCSTSAIGTVFAPYRQDDGKSIFLDNVEVKALGPVQLEGFDNITLQDFMDTEGNVMEAGEYEGNSGGAHKDYYATGLTNFDKKVLSMKVKFEAGSYKNSLILAGNNGWCGFNIHPNDNGTQLAVDKTWISGMTSSETPTLSASVAGVDSFLNKEFMLQLSFEYSEPVNGQSDLTLGIYINGKLYNNETFTIAACDTSKIGTVFAPYRQDDGKSIFLDNVILEEDTEPDTPDTPDEPAEIIPVELDGFTTITVGDFLDNTGSQMAETTYDDTNSSLEMFTLKDYDSFDQKLVSFNVKFIATGDWTTRLDIGGAGDWQGVSVRPSANGNVLHIGDIYGQGTGGSVNIAIADVNATSFVNDEFLLQLSFDFGEVVNNKADLAIGIYINGELCATHTLSGCDMSKFGKYMRVYREPGSSITLGSVGGSTETPDEPTGIVPVELEGFTNLTIQDFVDKNGAQMPTGEYEGNSGGANNDYYVDGLANFDKHLLSMKITYGGGDYKHSLVVGGTGEWSGFNLRPNGDGSILFIDSSWAGSIIDKTTYVAPYMTAELAGLDSFIGEEILLQLSFEYGEVVNGKADLTIGVYINGQLYNNETFTIPNCNVSAMGSHLALYREVDGSSIIVDNVVLGEDTPDVPDVPDTPIVPNEELEKITFSNFGIVDDIYPYVNGDLCVQNSLQNKDSMAGTLFNGDISFNGSGHFQMIFGGVNGAWDGLRVIVENNNEINLYWYQGNDGQHLGYTNADVIGNTFIGQKLNVKLSMEVVNNDLKVGLWINDVAATNDFIIIEGAGTQLGNKFGVYCSGTDATVTIGEGRQESEQPNPDLEKVTFSHFGIDSDEYNYNGDLVVQGPLEGKDSVAGTVLCGDVELSGSGHFQLILGGGENAWDGIRFVSDNDQAIHVWWYEGTTGTHYATFTQDVAGVDFRNESMSLMISTEIIDNDIKLGVWFDGVLYGDEYIIIPDCGDKLANKFAAYCAGASDAVIITSDPDLVGDDEPDTPDEPTEIVPVELEGFENVTIRDLVDASGQPMEDKTYVGDAAGAMDAFSWKNGTSFDKVLLNMNVEFTAGGGNNRIDVAGNGEWSGFSVFASNSGEYLHIYTNYGFADPAVGVDMSATTAGVETFLEKEFLLQLSMQLVDSDSDGDTDDLEVGVYINGALYNDAVQLIPNVNLSKFGDYVGLYREGADKAITVGSVGEDTSSEGEQPNPDLEKVTFSQYGIAEGGYLFTGDLVVKGELEDKASIAGTVLCGDVELSGSGHFQLILGGGDNAWDGIRFVSDKADALHVWWYEGTNGTHITSFYATDAGVSFQNENINMMISTEVIDNDIKLGVWFNGTLYNNEYITIEDKGDKLANGFAAYCANESASVILTSDPELKGDDAPIIPDEPQRPNEEFEKITFAHFGVKDGTYAYNGDIVAHGALKGKGSLDKTVICGDVLLDGSMSFQLLFGGKEDTWDGLRLFVGNADNMHLYWFNDDGAHYLTTYTSVVAGTAFVGEQFNLMLSTEVVGDDIQFGLWINDVLYNNQYVTFEGFADELGNMFGAYCEGTDASISLNSIPELMPPVEPPKKPNPDFERITFDYFGAKDGLYKYDGTDAPTFEGKGNDSLDEKVLCGDVLFSGKGENHFMVGGNGNTWYAFRFITKENGTIQLWWVDKEGMPLIEIFDSTTAGTTLVGEWLNLMISTEILDADGDGVEDDIELGVWFNGVLYKEQYYTILDKASGLGKQFGFDCMGEDNSIAIRSIPELVKGFDYGAYGLTKDWEKTLITDHKVGMAVGGSRDAEPFTGDLLKIGGACLFGTATLAAVVAGIYVMLQRKKES